MTSSQNYQKLKSFLEPPLALLLFILTLPISLLIYLLVKSDSPGPGLFSQIRVGKNQKLFRFYKFRTMYHDAEKRYPQLYRYEYSKEEIKTLRFKIPNDPRHTRFGNYLRKTSLDELPNLINVIKGEMSLIGPRPEIPQMLMYYRKDQLAKFSVRPGVTGYAQVKGRGLLTLQETIKTDLEYIKDQAPLVDLQIILRTIWVMLRGVGAF